MKVKKDYGLSMVRLLATVMILFCHICETIGYDYEYSNLLGVLGNYLAAGVQIFLLLSGVLYGGRRDLFEKESRISFVCRNFKKILLDYYVYVFIVIFPVYYFLEPVDKWTILKVLTCSGTMGGVHHLWFIPYILFCYLLTPFLYDLKKYMMREYSIGGWLTIVGGGCIIIELIAYSYGTYFDGTWMCCYYFGFFLPDIMKHSSPKVKSICSVLAIIFNIPVTCVWYWLRYVVWPQLGAGTWEYTVCEVGINVSRSFTALAILLAVWQMGMFLRKRHRQKDMRILAWSDRLSYDIYIAHMIYVKGVLSLIGMTQNYLLNILLVLLAAILSGIILNYICVFIRAHSIFGGIRCK